MAQSPLLGLPIPEDIEAADGPDAFAELCDALEKYTLLPATSESNRNAKYGSQAAGVIVVCYALKTVWLKTGAGTTDWTTLYSDTGWMTFDPGAFTDSVFNDSSSKWRIRNGQVTIHGRVEYQGGDIVLTTSSNIQDMKVFSLPGVALPQENVVSIFHTALVNGGAFGVVLGYASGGVWMTNIVPYTSLLPGMIVTFNFSYSAKV